MPKTVISIQKELFDQAEALANEMGISRSRLFTLALEEFLRHRQNQKLIEQINAAYEAKASDADDLAAQRPMRRHQRQIVEGEW